MTKNKGEKAGVPESTLTDDERELLGQDEPQLPGDGDQPQAERGAVKRKKKEPLSGLDRTTAEMERAGAHKAEDGEVQQDQQVQQDQREQKDEKKNDKGEGERGSHMPVQYDDGTDGWGSTPVQMR